LPHLPDPSVGRLADAALASSGMTPIRPRTCPGVLLDHRPFYDDPPPSIGSGDFLAREQPAPFRCLSRPPATHQRVHSRSKFSDLRPPLRPTGQRRSARLRSGPLTFWSATAATSSRSSTDTMENCRVGHLRARVYRGETRLSVEAQAIETETAPILSQYVPRVHRERNPAPMTLEPRLLEYT